MIGKKTRITATDLILLAGVGVAVVWLYLWAEFVRTRPRKFSAIATFAGGLLTSDSFISAPSGRFQRESRSPLTIRRGCDSVAGWPVDVATVRP